MIRSAVFIQVSYVLNQHSNKWKKTLVFITWCVFPCAQDCSKANSHTTGQKGPDKRESLTLKCHFSQTIVMWPQWFLTNTQVWERLVFQAILLVKQNISTPCSSQARLLQPICMYCWNFEMRQSKVLFNGKRAFELVLCSSYKHFGCSTTLLARGMTTTQKFGVCQSESSLGWGSNERCSNVSSNYGV
jgi:hypothetical protein